jgi:hypothetical protein
MSVVRDRITSVWVLLSVLTVGSWGLAMVDRHAHHGSRGIEIVAVLTIAVVKGRLIVRDFMEVRDAPRWLRLATDGWLAAFWVSAVALSLAA